MRGKDLSVFTVSKFQSTMAEVCGKAVGTIDSTAVRKRREPEGSDKISPSKTSIDKVNTLIIPSRINSSTSLAPTFRI